MALLPPNTDVQAGNGVRGWQRADSQGLGHADWLAPQADQQNRIPGGYSHTQTPWSFDTPHQQPQPQQEEQYREWYGPGGREAYFHNPNQVQRRYAADLERKYLAQSQPTQVSAQNFLQHNPPHREYQRHQTGLDQTVGYDANCPSIALPGQKFETFQQYLQATPMGAGVQVGEKVTFSRGPQQSNSNLPAVLSEATQPTRQDDFQIQEMIRKMASQRDEMLLLKEQFKELKHYVRSQLSALETHPRPQSSRTPASSRGKGRSGVPRAGQVGKSKGTETGAPELKKQENPPKCKLEDPSDEVLCSEYGRQGM